jgi:hypothetical protein
MATNLRGYIMLFSTVKRPIRVLSNTLIISTLLLSTSAHSGEKVDKTLDTSSSPKIDIQHVNGQADIRVWDKSQVRVTGELGDNTEEFTFEQRGDVVVVHVEVKRAKKGWWGKDNEGDELVIYVPANSDVDYSAVNADVRLEGVRNGVDIDVVNGDVSLNNVAQHIDVESVNGDLSLMSVEGRVNAETVNGEIALQHSGKEAISVASVNGRMKVETTSPDVSVESVNGRIELALSHIDMLRVTTVNGRIDANLVLNENGTVKASSVGGAMDFNFQKEVSAQFDIEAHAGGDIINKLSKDEVKEPKYGPSSWLRFTNNGGRGNVDISTVHGRIVLDQK